MVTIRQAERGDHAAVVDLWSCASFKAMLPKAHQDGLPPERSYLASAASAMTRSGGLFLIREGDAIVGTLNRFGKPDAPEIGWFVAAPARGRGVATEAVSAFLDRLFNEGHRTVGIGMFASNAASVRIAERLGLVPSPAAEDMPNGHLRFDVGREEWSLRGVNGMVFPNP